MVKLLYNYRKIMSIGNIPSSFIQNITDIAILFIIPIQDRNLIKQKTLFKKKEKLLIC